MVGFGKTLMQTSDFTVPWQQLGFLFHLDPLQKTMMDQQGMSDGAQHLASLPRQSTGTGEIAGERFEHLDEFPDFFFLEGERDILGKRIDNGNKARR